MGATVENSETGAREVMQPWIQTRRGRAVSLLHPKAEDIDGAELACLLSRLNRFGGHTVPAYTVAEHSLRVSGVVSKEGGSPLMALVALLHDAHEGYLGCDISSPLKSLLGKEFKEVTDVWDAAIAERFGFRPELFHDPVVKRADRILLATERRDLLEPCDVEWEMELPEPLVDKIVPQDADWEVADAFLKHLRELLDLHYLK